MFDRIRKIGEKQVSKRVFYLLTVAVIVGSMAIAHAITFATSLLLER